MNTVDNVAFDGNTVAQNLIYFVEGYLM